MFSRFGLEMHVRNETKVSKTEAVFFSPPSFFRPPPSLPASKKHTFALPLISKQKQGKKQVKELERIRFMIVWMKKIIKVPNDSILTFCKHFKYLGNFILYNLKNDYNIGQRLAQVSKSMGALQHL